METGRSKIVILGGGVSGLAAAYRLSQKPKFEIHVVDKELSVGGVCRSFKEGDFILDYGPHKFYTLLEGILDEVKNLLGDELLEREKKQSIYLSGRYFSFPLKMSEMMMRFPAHKSAAALSSYVLQMIKNMGTKKKAMSYEDFIIERFGPSLYRQVFEPMAHKIFGSPSQLDRKLAEVRVSSPGLIAILKQLCLGTKVDKSESAPSFHYPKYGYGSIAEKLKNKSEENGVRFHLGAKLLKIEIGNSGRVVAVVIQNKMGQTERLLCDELVYTVPLNLLGELMGDQLPKGMTGHVEGVRYRHVIIYYFLLKSKRLLPSMWVFFPESRFRFGRLSEMIQFSPFTAPPGHTSLMVDFTCTGDDPAWSMDDVSLGKLLYKQLEPLKLFTQSQELKRFSRRFKNFYPIYSIGYQQNLNSLRSLESTFGNLYFIGRLGDFNYNNADQCLDMGFRLGDHISERYSRDVNDISAWKTLRDDHFERYRIVD